MIKRKRHLVVLIRYGQIDALDAVNEIEKILIKRGHAWFGKYGQSLSPSIDKLLKVKDQEIIVVLIKNTKGKVTDKAQYKIHPFTLLGVSWKTPESKSDYPPYYLKHLGHVGTWLFIKRYAGPKFELSDLITKSSGMPVVSSLRSSMRGHFLCRLREGNEK